MRKTKRGRNSDGGIECTSGLYRLNQWRTLARGARLARRDEGAYRPYSTEKQRRQTGCPARRTVLIQSIQATSVVRARLSWNRPSPGSSCRDPYAMVNSV